MRSHPTVLKLICVALDFVLDVVLHVVLNIVLDVFLDAVLNIVLILSLMSYLSLTPSRCASDLS